MKDHRPSLQWYPSDWASDEGVRGLPLAPRMIWFEVLQLMFNSVLRGHLLNPNGKPPTDSELARLIGCSVREVKKYIPIIEANGVFSRTTEGIIFNRRMVRDEHIRNVRSEAGKQGGNPHLLVKQSDKQNPSKYDDLVKQNSKQNLSKNTCARTRTPAQSSSSSSSSSSSKTKREDPHTPVPFRSSGDDPSPSAGESVLHSSFKDFFGKYPRPDKPNDAEKAYDRAISAGATHAEIIAGLDHATSEWQRLKIEERYIPFAANWLKSGSWRITEPIKPKAADRYEQSWPQYESDPPLRMELPDEEEIADWIAIRDDLEKSLPPKDYADTFAQIDLAGVIADKWFLRCPTSDVRREILEYWMSDLRKFLGGEFELIIPGERGG